MDGEEESERARDGEKRRAWRNLRERERERRAWKYVEDVPGGYSEGRRA